MSRDEIEDGMGFSGLAPAPGELREERLIAQAIRDERERCAKIAEGENQERLARLIRRGHQ